MPFRAFSVLAFFLLRASVLSAPPKVVRLGGLFSQTRFDGKEVSNEEQQPLASFLLAIDEINRSNQILPDTKINISVWDTRSHVGDTFFAALNMSTKAFSGKGVDACIGAATSSESDAAATVFSHFSTVQVSFSATSPLLSSRINSPHFARTCPSDVHQGAAMAHLAAHYGWMKVSTFANSDSYGSSGIRQFEASAAECGIQILSSSLFPCGQEDFSKPIAEAIRAKAQIFVFFMSMIDMRNLLKEGYKKGLFHAGTQIIASDAVIIGSYWNGMRRSEVARMMKGMIAFTPAADYTSQPGKKFLDSFINQKNTNRDPRTKLCDDRMDDDNNYLFQNRRKNSSDSSCSGIDFSKFETDGSNVDNYASYTYDATYAVAWAMHAVLYDQKQPNLTGDNLYSALVHNVSFEGATGFVDFTNAFILDNTRNGEGDRDKAGVRYEILNFNPAEFVIVKDASGQRKNSTGFVNIGGWTIEGKITLSKSIVFNTVDNSVPSHLPPSIKLKMSDLYVTLLKAFGGILLLASVLFGCILRCYSHSTFVRSVKSKMQFIILTGALLGSARIFLGINPASDLNCSATMWLSHLPFWIILAPMVLKTYRVYSIVKPENIRLSEKCSIKIIGGVVLCVVAYLTALQMMWISTPIKHTVFTEEGLQIYSDDQCTSRGEGSQICIYIAEGLLLLLATVLCYLTKDVPGAINESPNILKAIMVGMCVAIICFPLITSLPGTSGGTKEFIRSTGTFISIFSTICILHGERAMLLLLNYDINKNHQVSKKKKLVAEISKEEFKKQSFQFRTMSQSQFGGSAENPYIAIKTENLPDRLDVCRVQHAHWSKVLQHTEAMMLYHAEDESDTVVGRRPASVEAVPVPVVQLPVVAATLFDAENDQFLEYDADSNYFDGENSQFDCPSESDFNEFYYSHPNPHIIIIPREI